MARVWASKGTTSYSSSSNTARCMHTADIQAEAARPHCMRLGKLQYQYIRILNQGVVRVVL
jgi:hypothetical protein